MEQGSEVHSFCREVRRIPNVTFPACCCEVSWLMSRIKLSKFNPEKWTDDNSVTARDFFTNQGARKLIVYIGEENAVVTLLDESPVFQQATPYQYFVRDGKEVTINNIKKLMYGVNCGQPMDSLLRTMDQVYAPQILSSVGWPASIKKDFTGLLEFEILSFCQLYG